MSKEETEQTRRTHGTHPETFDMQQPRYNTTTEKAMDEARDIMAGKKPAESYGSVADMLSALDR